MTSIESRATTMADSTDTSADTVHIRILNHMGHQDLNLIQAEAIKALTAQIDDGMWVFNRDGDMLSTSEQIAESVEAGYQHTVMPASVGG